MEITYTSVQEFVDQLESPRREDILTLIELGRKVTRKEPQLWGTIIGFGNLHYKYATGHEGNMPLFGLASRKHAITLYVAYELEKYSQLQHLGKHKIGKACLYINKLSDVRLEVLESLIRDGIRDTYNYDFITDNDATTV